MGISISPSAQYLEPLQPQSWLPEDLLDELEEMNECGGEEEEMVVVGEREREEWGERIMEGNRAIRVADKTIQEMSK